MHLQIY